MNIVGHVELKKHLKAVTDNAEAYRRGAIKPPNFIMNISRGNSQSIVAEYITSTLSDYQIRKFYGLDNLLEYKLDGSLNQLKYIFENQIISRAVYSNTFVGVIAFDISALAEHAYEYQADYFMDQISLVSQEATLIIYYDDQLGKPIEQIIQRIIESVRNCIDIRVKPYTTKEYSNIVVENIRERDIEIVYGKEMENLLCKIIDLNHISTAKQAISVADKLVLIADYSNRVPRIDMKIVNKYYSDGQMVV